MSKAIVMFRARPSMTAEWLQRVVDCHPARNAALGHVVLDLPDCPLVPKGVADEPTIREVLERSRRSRRSRAEASTR
jgi:hypothetical protein